MPCLMECDGLLELGPPPDLIAGMPPPPIPAFLRDPVDLLVAANGSCDLCGWADSDDVQLFEISRKYPVIDDMWYFVIVSAAVGAILFGVLIVIATLRCKEAKVKPVHDPCSKLEKAPSGRPAVEPVPSPPHPMALPPGVVPLGGGSCPKALWSGLRGTEGTGYSLRHHPISPELLSNYERVDYGSVGHSAAPPLPRLPPPSPPPLPANPPPPICPTYCNGTGGVRPGTGFNAGVGVRIMGNGNAYYANPDSLDGSFENGGFVDSECSSVGSVVEVRRVGPDGAVVGRRGRSCPTPVRGGGWEVAVPLGFDPQRVSLGPRLARLGSTCREQAVPGRDSFRGRSFALPPIVALNPHHNQVSSPLV